MRFTENDIPCRSSLPIWLCHAALGGVRRQFADDFAVFSGRGARKPVDLKSSAISIPLFSQPDLYGFGIERRQAERHTIIGMNTGVLRARGQKNRNSGMG